jgi:hypothetical protein
MRDGLISKFKGFLRGRAEKMPAKPSKPSKPAKPSKPSAATRDIDDTRVQVEYSPCLDGDPDPGEVVWTWVPYEDDPSQGKDRPVVIIGRRGGSLVGVPLTSKRHDNEPQVSVGTGSWDREGDQLRQARAAAGDRSAAGAPRRCRAVASALRRRGRGRGKPAVALAARSSLLSAFELHAWCS